MDPAREPSQATQLFRDPYEMLLFLDDTLLSGEVKLYPWQIQFMIDFASGDWKASHPFKAIVRAANGSGKDKYIIAACSVWFTMRFENGQAVVTSASGDQIDKQTSVHIKRLAESFNAKFGTDAWILNYRHYTFIHQVKEQFKEEIKSVIDMFVTDEAGRAEGWHNLVPGSKLAIFTSEAKSIPDEIFVALMRCTGFTHRVDVSSPGIPVGFFHSTSLTAISRKDIDNVQESVEASRWIEYHVTAYDCIHLNNEAMIEEMRKMMPEAAFRSSVLAEFGTTTEATVIPYEHVWKCMNKTSSRVGWLQEPVNIGGLDLSAGGDETCLSIRNGNKLLKVLAFKFTDTQKTVEYLVEQFKLNGLDKPNAYIYADAGGLGKPIIDQIRSKGWTNIRYVLNQAKAYNERVYLNRGAEMWFNFGKLLETGEVWLCQDDKMGKQLYTRYYKITETNKHKLESKLQARAAGRPSPDRADSVILCFSQYKSKLSQDDSAVKQEYKDIPDEDKSDTIPAPFDAREWVKQDEGSYFGGREDAVANKDIRRLKQLVAAINEEVKQKKEQELCG